VSDSSRPDDADAVQQLWERYFQRLVVLARKTLEGSPRRAAHEEDVALSAFGNFCRSAERGRFPRLLDPHCPWLELVMITARKAGQLAGEFGFEEMLSREPSPEFAAGVAEEFRRRLPRLVDNERKSVAVWKMEGYTNEEIAAKLGCPVPTVERRLGLIRKLWSQP
jgi:DNA-directed RNA polymerase specialized sigma24 family protein